MAATRRARLMVLVLGASLARTGHAAYSSNNPEGTLGEVGASLARTGHAANSNTLGQVYQGTLTHRRPHAGFVNGTAKIYLQHIRKAAGTTLCALLRANANATTTNCLYRRSLVSFRSLKDVASKMDGDNLDIIASEDGDLPRFVDDHLGGADPSWVFVTIMREPIGRILSSLHYEYGLLKLAWKEAQHRSVHGGEPFTADQQRKLVYSHAQSYLRRTLKGCRLDNYATRVFSHACQKATVTEQDYQLAAQNLRRFDMCFVSEWFAEMTPLVKYALGMQYLDSAPRNVMGFGPGWGSGRGDVSPSLPRSRVVERSSALTDSVTFFGGEDSDMLRHLRELNAFDMRLYRVCRLHARYLVNTFYLPH